SVLANNAANGGTAGASGAPPASGAPAASGGPPASGGPEPSGPKADVELIAKGIQFQESSFMAPANKPFSLAFHNEDAGPPHNVERRAGSGKVVFRGGVFSGWDPRVYAVPAQPAGAYKFSCTVHPSMTGTANIQ